MPSGGLRSERCWLVVLTLCGVTQYLAQHMMSFATLVALDMPETTLTAVLQTEGFERQVNKPFKPFQKST